MWTNTGLQLPWLSYQRQKHNVNMPNAADEMDIWEDRNYNSSEILCQDDTRGVWLYLIMFNSMGYKGTLLAVGERRRCPLTFHWLCPRYFWVKWFRGVKHKNKLISMCDGKPEVRAPPVCTVSQRGALTSGKTLSENNISGRSLSNIDHLLRLLEQHSADYSGSAAAIATSLKSIKNHSNSEKQTSLICQVRTSQ